MSDRCRIADITEQIRGVSYKPNDLHKELDENSVILLRANNIDDGSINFDDILYVDTSKVSKNQFLQKGDILICASSGSKHLVGKAAQVDFEGNYTFGVFCKVIRPIGISPEYVGLFFQSPNYRKKISDLAQGANINNIKNEHIDNLLLNIPSANRIKEITDILQRISKIILYRKQQLQQLDNLIKARFVEMFGDNYQSIKIGDVIKTTSGGTPSKKHLEYYEGGTIPWLTSSEVNAGIITSVKNTITEEGMKYSSAKIVPANSVVIAMYGATAGVTGILRITTTTNQAVCSLLPNEHFMPEFLYYAVASKKEWMISQCKGGGQPNISQSIIKNMDIVDAPIEAQKKFSDFANQVDKSKFHVACIDLNLVRRSKKSNQSCPIPQNRTFVNRKYWWFSFFYF